MRPAITRSCPGSARAMEPATRLKGWAWTSAPRVWPWVRAPTRPSGRRTPGVGIWHRGIAAGGSWGRLSGAGRQQRQRSGPGTQSPGRAGPPPQIIGCVQHVIRSKFCRDSHVGIAHNFAHPDFRSWLKADIQSLKIDFRFTPNFGHSDANVRFSPDYVRLSPNSRRKWARRWESACDPGCVKTQVERASAQ